MKFLGPRIFNSYNRLEKREKEKLILPERTKAECHTPSPIALCGKKGEEDRPGWIAYQYLPLYKKKGGIGGRKRVTP